MRTVSRSVRGGAGLFDRRRHPRTHRVLVGVAVLSLLPNLLACHSYVPVRPDATTVQGTEVAVRVTDRGRVMLERQVGAGAQRLEGRLVSATDSTLSLALTSVRYVDNPATVRWTGETVTIARDVVVDVSERRLSRSRSWLAGGIAALVVAALSTLAIEGFGGGGGEEPPGNGNQQE
jgi:hypothetical protein